MNTVQDLIDKLLLYFNAEKVNAEVIDSARTYIQKLNLGNVELILFYEALKENHESMVFPKVYQIKKIWNEHGVRYSETRSTKDVNKAREDYRRTGHNDVVRQIKIIRDKQANDEKVSNKEIDLVATYEDLCYICGVVNSLPDGVMDREHKEIYLRKAKETIDSGIPINFTAFEREMNRRRAQAVEMYGEQDAEIDSILSKSVSDIENAFGARSKELELSDYEKEQCRLGFR